ncbi:3 exoribonuclease family [Pyrenophora seminiperda CCB06]|uniref:3 exoribonuclease family n=1 Tax=Pyrenophora seminiperda CCB06 TaxID=1302712 RepID=A0A3M7LVJ8_9PLEO|nr:3 exoribonuclease family [Pyrenophora seminiperda CCB06]
MSESSVRPQDTGERYVSAPFHYTLSAHQDSAYANQSDSPFMRLPGELRNQVYEYYFSDSIMIIKDTDPDNETEEGKWFKNRYHNTRPSDLLETCRQIRDEVTPLFWSHITCGLHIYTPPQRLESLMGRSKCALIRKLRITECWEDWFDHHLFEIYGFWDHYRPERFLFKALETVYVAYPEKRMLSSRSTMETIAIWVKAVFNEDNIEVVCDVVPELDV